MKSCIEGLESLLYVPRMASLVHDLCFRMYGIFFLGTQIKQKPNSLFQSHQRAGHALLLLPSGQRVKNLHQYLLHLLLDKEIILCWFRCMDFHFN